MHNKAIVSNQTKVLIPSQSLNIKPSVIKEMICRRCPQSRRISYRQTHLDGRHRRRMVRLREYQRLRDSVPSIARRPVDKLTVITEATRLIGQLEAAVINKFNAEGVPQCCLEGGQRADLFERILRSINTKKQQIFNDQQVNGGTYQICSKVAKRTEVLKNHN